MAILNKPFKVVLVMAFLVTSALAALAAGNEESLEYPVKAAYLFKFAGFVEWPASAFSAADTPLKIIVLGEDPFGSRLDQVVRGRTVDGRPIEVVRTQQIERARAAHILFISQSERARLDSIIDSLAGNNVLTVAEFDLPGVVMTFVIENNKVRFQVDLDQARRFDLKLSSKLLSVAKTVKGK